MRLSHSFKLSRSLSLFVMAAPAAAAGQKRKVVPAVSPANVHGLDSDEEEEDDMPTEWWMEPREFCDWTIVVELDGFTLKVHVHRVKLSTASPRWWMEFIKENMTDGIPSTVFKAGVGPWKNRAELKLYLEVVYAYPRLGNRYTYCTLSVDQFTPLLHALDFTQCINDGQPQTGLFVDVSNEFKRLVMLNEISMVAAVELAARYKWGWMHEYIVGLLLGPQSSMDDWGPSVVWKSPTVAAAIAPLLLRRARRAEYRVKQATGCMQEFRESFDGNAQDYCDDEDECNHRDGKCAVDHSLTSAQDYNEDPCDALNNIENALVLELPEQTKKKQKIATQPPRNG